MKSSFYSNDEIAAAEAQAAEAYKYYLVKYHEWEDSQWWQFATRGELKNEADRAYALWQELLRVVANMKVQNQGDVFTDETLSMNSGLESTAFDPILILIVGAAAVFFVYKFL